MDLFNFILFGESNLLEIFSDKVINYIKGYKGKGMCR